MKKSILLTIILTVVSHLSGAAVGTWQPDILGTGFEMRHVAQGYDYAGEVRSTIVRSLSSCDSLRRGVLYVHGFNDYFFQAEMARRFTSEGWDFYAVDLRKYGRSLLPDNFRCGARNIDEYFPDIDSAVVEMERAGLDCIVLMGHSTGGLIASCYMSRVYPPVIKALILNSPFLDWNLGREEKLIPLVCALGRWFPDMKISQGESSAYAESLLRDYHGEWDYRRDWKSVQSPDVTAGWVRAITLAQRSLRDGKADIRVPILLMRSAHSVEGSEWTEEHNRADGVLDVNDIAKYGMELGPDVKQVVVPDGLHDLVLSRPGVRVPLYNYIFRWLDRTVPCCGCQSAA